jgi:peptidyl-tRNA hydrolase
VSRQTPAEYVLSGFSKDQKVEIPEIQVRGADAVASLTKHGVEQTQAQFNS